MNMRAILVDDEEKALKSLQIKVQKLFPEIAIVATIQNPVEAIKVIEQEKPDLIFLDIEMPQLNGFDVLQKLKKPEFEIIFVTAYSDYAIEAIQHCAIGYVVKPIDNDDLKAAVTNAIKNRQLKTALKKNQTLIENLQNQSADSKVIIPSQKGLDFVKISNIIRCEGEGGYTKIVIHNAKDILSSYSIGKFVKMLQNKNFYSIHRSHLVNLKYVSGYLNEGYITLNNGDSLPISKSNRQSFIEQMSEL
ncbi:MAG TPA: response regulator transcription factor [Lutibacter sp.]|nr:response regulator transcription factor [Lutibacter sp.]